MFALRTLLRWSAPSVSSWRASAAAIISSKHTEIPGPINLQEVDGEVKPYQIRQFLRLVERYNLRLEDRS